MIKVFIDSSVFFSACYSKIGASALLLGYCRKRKVQGVVSRYVLAEVKRNAALKLDQTGKQRLNFYVLQTHLTIINRIPMEDIQKYPKIVDSKDVEIVAGAIYSQCPYLITYDRKHLLTKHLQQKLRKLKILTPADFVHLFSRSPLELAGLWKNVDTDRIKRELKKIDSRSMGK